MFYKVTGELTFPQICVSKSQTVLFASCLSPMDREFKRDINKTSIQNSTCFAGYVSCLCLKCRSSDVPRSPSAMVQPEPRAAWKAQRRMEECVPSLKGRRRKTAVHI